MSVVSFIPLRPSNFSTADLETVKAAPNRDEIGGRLSQIWDRLVDYICSTNRVEAKKCLFDMLSPLTTDRKKIESFEKLGKLLDGGFTGTHTKHLDDDGNESYTLRLPDSAQPCFSLNRTNYPCDREAIQREINADREEDDSSLLMKDIDRGNYYIEDSPLEGSAPERRKTWDDRLAELACTDAQQATLASICTQRTFASILTNVQTTPSQSTEPPQCIEQKKSIIEYRLSRGDNNTMVARGRCVLDLAAQGNPERLSVLLSQAEADSTIQNSADYMFEIGVDQDGKATLTDLHYLCRRDVPENGAA